LAPEIFGAFALISAIIGLKALASYGVLTAAGTIAVTTFDGPLMAINYARAAQKDFTEMQLAELRFEQASAHLPGPPSCRRDRRPGPDLPPTSGRRGPAQPAPRRAAGDFSEIRPLVETLGTPRAPRARSAELVKLDRQIDERVRPA
jgi:hypothetical protein